MTDEVMTHPVQHRLSFRGDCRAPAALTLRAYEVYAHVHQPQPAMIEGGCRGGFAIGELMAYLYARSFPKEEWEKRVDEALRGMVMP